MGIRLFKKLGWGLTGLERHENGTLADPRVNTDALGPRSQGVGSGYLEYLKTLQDRQARESADWFDLMLNVSMVEEILKREKEVAWPVTWGGNGGIRDLILVQPVGFHHWTRYGDALDQAEENALYPDEYHRIVPMPYGVYPFEGLYMDSRDGRPLDTTAKRFMERLLEQRRKSGDGAEYGQLADKLAVLMGFDDPEEAEAHIAPAVPPDIRYVCDWLGLFTSPDVVLQLRPMLYTYWS